MLVDFRAKDPVVKKLGDGKFDVTFDVNARKYYADDQGKETEKPLDEPIDIGFFLAEPGKGKFNARDVVQLSRRRIHTGWQKIHFVLPVAPVYVGVDPYNKWIDRYPDCNVVKVGN